MAGLILKLRPHEQLLINGVVVENGDRKAQLKVCSEGANILRLRDAMRPEDAKTPIQRAYYIAQTAVAGALTTAQAEVLFTQALKEAAEPEIKAIQPGLETLAARGEFYKAMRLISPLIQRSEKTGAMADSRTAGRQKRALS